MLAQFKRHIDFPKRYGLTVDPHNQMKIALTFPWNLGLSFWGVISEMDPTESSLHKFKNYALISIHLLNASSSSREAAFRLVSLESVSLQSLCS